jgi:hypothetical protein
MKHFKSPMFSMVLCIFDVGIMWRGYIGLTAIKTSNLRKMGYIPAMKPALQQMPVEPEKLKPALHDKIERMDCSHLSLLNRVLLQMEAEELAARLSDGFDKDYEQGLLRRIPELMKHFRDEHRYA